MRCPKCQYIGFDSSDRCRNCGYEFSLYVEDAPIDVTIGRDEPGPGRLSDLTLEALDPTLTAGDPPSESWNETDPDRAGGRRGSLAEADLPLFTDSVADDQAPLITPPAVPRPPLSVRRAHPALPRERPGLRSEPRLDLAPDPEASGRHLSQERQEDPRRTAAPLPRRVGAGLIDVAVLGTLAAAVVYLTLRLTELTVADWHVLPMVPMGAFLLLLCGGYLVLFTAAGGQTIGKMVTRIRVVAAPADTSGVFPVSFGTALVRAVACFCSVAPLGAGFVPALLSDDRRAFHDRIADTRVVSA